MRISDWSSDVCSSDLRAGGVDRQVPPRLAVDGGAQHFQQADIVALGARGFGDREQPRRAGIVGLVERMPEAGQRRSEEHTSELQSLMRISYAVFCLNKKKRNKKRKKNNTKPTTTVTLQYK